MKGSAGKASAKAHPVQQESTPGAPRTCCIALLRGINVGKAKRIAMADLRTTMEALGYTRVRTLLNSGNIVFDAPHFDRKAIGEGIAAAIVEKLGVSASVAVLKAIELHQVVAGNPLGKVAASEPARFLVAFFSDPAMRAETLKLSGQSWGADQFSVGKGAVYLYCAAGILDSPLQKALTRTTRGAVTARNWTTVLKLDALARQKDVQGS